MLRTIKSHLMRVLCVIVVLPFFSQAVFAADSLYNLPYGVTPISHDIYRMHMIMIYICCATGVIVFGALIYCLIKFRHSKGVIADQTFTQHVGIEIAWTVIPFLILVAMAVPATEVLSSMHNDTKPMVNIKVTGYQWKWRYEYLDQGIQFFSNLSTPQDQIDGTAPKDPHYLLEVDHPLVLPTNEKIRFLITSNDVIHSWWVPDLGVKQDAIPGYVNETWAIIEKPGTYRGQCGELCGAFHGFMPIVIKAVPPAEFQQWVAKQEGAAAANASKALPTLTLSDLMSKGQAIYSNKCAACHQPTGKGLPPMFPAIQGDLIATGPVAKHIDIVLHGVTGTAMQAFGDQLDDTDLAAVITYQRNAWGNNKISKVNVVEPSDVEKMR